MTEMSPAEEVFFAALGKDPADRPAYLDEACAGKPELRARVEKLLAAHPKAGNFLADPHPAAFAPGGPADPTRTFPAGDPDPTASHRPAGAAPGAVVAGRYKLLQPIGEGGMGTVWMADQTEPVRRRVAVKLIRAERGQSRTILARFEAERQAIALMDHPHIAKLLDAGTTEAGEPFFVMELVKGVPLTDFCDAHRLTVPERLHLFTQVCGAVQHAHQKGIIHRDLKPSNVLVESHDGRPVPKVIDFGLAKAAAGLRLTDQTLFTAFGAVLGTPQYMAPEQADFNAVDVDTRADVYALGVVLYELLAGSPPITREALRAAAVGEMLRAIREDDPPPPSSRISGSAGKPSIAANRQTEPARLGRFVRGELDWIVMKALSKDRDRRYESATGLARDVERFLNHEPVAAGPPTAGYKLRKFVRRNRGPVAAAGLVLAALLAGIAGTTWQAVRATQAEGRTADQLEKTREAEAAATAEAGKARAAEAVAVEREKKEAAARKEADDQRKAATEKAAAATAAKEFLQSVLVQGDPDEATKDRAADLNRTLRAALDWASKDIEGRFADQPAIAADLRGTIGVAYRELGAYAAAERHLRAALSFSETAHGPDHPDTRASVNNLAVLYRKMGELAAAERLLKRALAGSEKVLGPDHLTTLVYVHNLALLYQDLGDLKAAEPLYNRALAGEEKALGPDHPETLTAVHNLATLYQYKGDLAAAERLLKRALAGREKALGPDHPRTLSSAANLAQLYWLMDRLDRSVPLFEDVYPRMRRVLGDGHPDTLITVANLGVNLKDAGGAAEGVPLLEQAYAARAKYPAQLGWVGHQLIDAYAKAGQPTDAKRVAGEVLAEGRARLKPGSPDLGGLLATTGSQLLDLDPAAAEPVLRECLELRQKLAPAAWTTANAKSLLGGALLRRGKPAEAEALLVAGYEGLLADRRNIPPLPAAQVNLPDAADRLVEVYRTLNRPAEVARWRAERAKYPPPTAPPPRPVVK